MPSGTALPFRVGKEFRVEVEGEVAGKVDVE
jgi:hypothetical protein